MGDSGTRLNNLIYSVYSICRFPLTHETHLENGYFETQCQPSKYVCCFCGGILLPILETIRRWHQLADLRYFITWFDDYIIGGFLFFSALKTYKLAANGVNYLIAAWGFATGMCFYSFFGQLQRIHEPDPGPLSAPVVVFIKGIMFLICVVCLIFSLDQRPPK